MINLVQDELCVTLSRYLAEGLNAKFLKEFPLYTDKNIKLVKSIRAYDDPQIPLDQFPVLKVIRNSDIYIRGNFKYRKTQLSITYACSFADITNLQGILVYVSEFICESLQEFALTHKYQLPNDFKDTLSVSYGTGMSQLSQAVFPFLNVNLYLNDNCIK